MARIHIILRLCQINMNTFRIGISEDDTEIELNTECIQRQAVSSLRKYFVHLCGYKLRISPCRLDSSTSGTVMYVSKDVNSHPAQDGVLSG